MSRALSPSFARCYGLARVARATRSVVAEVVSHNAKESCVPAGSILLIGRGKSSASFALTR